MINKINNVIKIDGQEVIDFSSLHILERRIKEVGTVSKLDLVYIHKCIIINVPSTIVSKKTVELAIKKSLGVYSVCLDSCQIKN